MVSRSSRRHRPSAAAILDRLIGALGAPAALAVCALAVVGLVCAVYGFGVWLGVWS